MSGSGDSFEETARRVWSEGIAIQVDAAGEIIRQLRLTLDRIDELLAGQPTDWQSWYLPQLRRQVIDLLAGFGEQAGATASDGAGRAWDKGVDVVDAPLATGGIRLEALTPRLDPGQLLAMQSFLTNKMRAVAADTANRINTALGMVVTGLDTPAEVATAIQGILGGSTRRRALTVVRTELGRAFSTATQGRLEQASKAGLKGLKKQWRRSGKIHSRRTHDLADGQIRNVDEPFLVGGEKLMYPRDPNGSPANTINCGCTQLPYMAHWEVIHPGEKPYTPAELGADPTKRDIAGVRAEGFRQWSGSILGQLAAIEQAKAEKRPRPKLRTMGAWQTVGALSHDVLSFLEGKSIRPATMEIAIGDKQLGRMRRTGSKGKKAVMLPDAILTQMPILIERPKAVFWGNGALHYIFDVPEARYPQVPEARSSQVPNEQRLGHLVVRVRADETRARHRHHNYVVSGGLTPRSALLDDKVFKLVTGAL
ncbi:MAG: hypothetical protein HQL34_05500 [Alphaproteobacteria bacterium]|nr:hypothetical protein [Alphaproteobacteria bacterium]